MSNAQNRPPSPAIVHWILWFALTTSIVVIHLFLSGSAAPTPKTQVSSTVVQSVIGANLLLAAVIRWILLPKQADLPKKLVLMVLGLALSEGAVVFSTFLIPGPTELKTAIFVAGLLSAFQFVPVWARSAPVKSPFGTNG